jgi:predicted RNA-binding Zn ribbon-like protein
MPRTAVPNPAFRYDTGTPWLDLLATVGNAYGDRSVERMRGLPELVEWLGHQGLTPQQPPTEDDLASVRELRALLRPVVLAELAGEPIDPAVLGALQPWLDRAVPPRVEVRDGRAALAPPPTVDAALAVLCRQAVEFLAGPGSAHLHACADPACHMAFVDPTGRRRWCSAEICGVKARVRAHRARAVRVK